MKEYIDREALIAHIKSVPTWWADEGGVYPEPHKYPDGMYDPEDVINSIENTPIADVTPVRHGKWIIFNDGTKENPQHDHLKCGLCGWYWSIPEHCKTFQYCPNCGAKVDGGEGCDDGTIN